VPTTPAAQLSHAVAALHVRPDGGSQLTIRLDPAELGHIHVQIDRAHDGAASISVAVEKLETLHALQADFTHLHLALDRAGIADQRSLTVHLAPPPAAPQTADSLASGAGGQTGNQAGGHAGGQPGAFQQPSRSAPPQLGEHAGEGAAATFVFGQPAAASISARLAGLNITA
jgi:hypothetical protein